MHDYTALVALIAPLINFHMQTGLFYSRWHSGICHRRICQRYNMRLGETSVSMRLLKTPSGMIDFDAK